MEIDSSKIDSTPVEPKADFSIYNELISLADEELKIIEQLLPQDPIPSFVLFTETIRISDYLQLGKPDPSNEYGLSFQELDIMKMGWNLAASLLFKPINILGFPIIESTKETRNQAAGLLYKLGCTSLLRRTAEMVKSGILNSEKAKNTFTFTKTKIADYQFLDEMELSYLYKLESKIKAIEEKYYSGWNLVGTDDLDKVFWKPGNFLSLKNTTCLSNFKIENIDSEMLPLIKPWNSGHGIMMGYGSTPEIDHHFLAMAAESVREWRDEAGFHPEAKIGEITGSDILAVVTFIVSFHLKHVHFASLASKKHPEILIPQSLTIWKPLDEMVQNITDFSRMDKKLVSKALESIMLKPSDVNFLRTHTSRFMPLIIDIGNGFILRPVSSILRNPLHTISALLESRNINFRYSISSPREEWFRTYLYAMFLGARYQTVEGNIKLREENTIITDIDAAIYDNVSGQLALFQIKWQDYFLNDVKKLRSKASNLTKEFDEWANKVSNWIGVHGTAKLIKNLRLKNLSPSNIYLFGLSKNAARMQGYGFTVNAENIAIGTWAQFIRNRVEIGPSPEIFEKIFQSLKKQEKDTISPKPMPIKISVADKVLHYQDLWSAVDD